VAVVKEHSEYECARAWAALSAAHDLVSERLGATLTRSCGLSINDFEVLLRLDQVPSPGLRVTDLRETVRLSQPAVSRMITRLEQQGLIGRGADPDDGRGVLVTITASGRKKLRRAVPMHAQVVRECLLDRLDRDESVQLSAILDRIVQ
jgi:DNA-binding MarR family transcriptional regulator